MRAHLTTLAVGTFLLGATALAAPSAAQEDCGFVCDGIMTTDDVPSTEDIVGPATDAILEPGYDTDLYTTDADGDGLTDDRESDFRSNPYMPDTDGDWLLDGQEVYVYGTDPTNPDTDGDGLYDDEEVTYTFTSPLSPDTDGDGVGDLTEYRNGTLPCSAEFCAP